MGNACPSERHLFPSFVLHDHQGKKFDLERFRQVKNLVLFFVSRLSPVAETLLADLAASVEALATEEAVVIVIVRGSVHHAAAIKKDKRFPFHVLSDERGVATGSYCDGDISVYITDKFREIYAVRHGDRLLSRDEILEWLAHINRQCPE